MSIIRLLLFSKLKLDGVVWCEIIIQMNLLDSCYGEFAVAPVANDLLCLVLFVLVFIILGL